MAACAGTSSQAPTKACKRRKRTRRTHTAPEAHRATQARTIPVMFHPLANESNFGYTEGMKVHDANRRQPSRMKGSGRHWPTHGAQKSKEKK